jgi:hypothetical protein
MEKKYELTIKSSTIDDEHAFNKAVIEAETKMNESGPLRFHINPLGTNLITLTELNIPTEEVIGINKYGEMLVGHIRLTTDAGYICEDENTELLHVLYYIEKPVLPII